MSKLALEQQVPAQYDKAAISGIVRAITGQVNSLSEGALQARYQAQVSVPVSVAAGVGDIVWDSNTTVRGSVAPGVAASYVRLGWVCTVAGNPATWQEIRTLTGA